jgi:hypothetical protein
LTKSSTCISSARGLDDCLLEGSFGSHTKPVYRHRSCKLGVRPTEQRMAFILSYQWRGLQRRPYRVLRRSQYSSLDASGSPEGGLTIVVSSAGRMPWQKAFLQSPCLRARRCWVDILTKKRRLLNRRLGAKRSLLDQSRFSQMPNTTIRDLARRGINCFLFDSEDKHCRDGLWSALLTKCPVLTQSYLPEGTHFFNTTFLLMITLEPDLTIRVSRGQNLKEAGRTVSVQVHCSHNVYHRVKGEKGCRRV